MHTCCDAPSSQCLLEGWHCFGARWSARWSRFEEHCGTAAWDDSATGAWTVGVASNPPEKKKNDIPEVSGFSIGKMHETSLHVLFEKGCWTLNIYIYIYIYIYMRQTYQKHMEYSKLLRGTAISSMKPPCWVIMFHNIGTSISPSQWR